MEQKEIWEDRDANREWATGEIVRQLEYLEAQAFLDGWEARPLLDVLSEYVTSLDNFLDRKEKYKEGERENAVSGLKEGLMIYRERLAWSEKRYGTVSEELRKIDKEIERLDKKAKSEGE